MKRNVFLQDVPNVSVNRGLIVFQINPSDGSLESSAVFDMTVGGLAIGSMITNFNNTLNGLYIYMYIYIYIYGCCTFKGSSCNHSMQSVPISTKIVSSNPAHGEVYSLQYYVIKFVCNLR
jgi:hypothetical protein